MPPQHVAHGGYSEVEMTSALVLSERRIGSVTLLEVSGHLVADDGDRVFMKRVTSLVGSGCLNLLVDLRNITYIDSGGVGALVAMYLHVRSRGGRFKLLCPSNRACRVLQITHLDHVFEVFEREEDALRTFATPPAASSDVHLTV
jgi:anti-anti-sigma factor